VPHVSPLRRGFAACLLLLTLPATAQTCPDRLPSATLSTRIDALIARLTPSERIAQLGDRAPAVPRLGIPAYNWWNEGLHGIARNGYATVFPQAIALAATFDPALLQQVGETVSTEARAKFNPHASSDSARYAGLTIWSPNINIFRDPRWGRGQETYGEDPTLTATLGAAFVAGIQGPDPFYRRADATPKHFAAHSGPELGRDSFNAAVTPHDLADTYLPAFHQLTTTSAALMCSYNAIDGTPSCANSPFLNGMLRGQWHFPGYVVSDCDAVGNLTAYHHYTPDPAHGAAAALNAGTDLDCGNSYAALNQALAQHLVTQSTIDRALHRLFLARIQLGMPLGPTLDLSSQPDPTKDLSSPQEPGAPSIPAAPSSGWVGSHNANPANPATACSPYAAIPPTANDTPAHRALALRAAEESIVLLHNDRTLPLKPTQRLALIGPTADALNILEANYHGTASHPITLLDGLQQSFRQTTYAQGSLLAAGVSSPIPRTALRSSTAPNATPGLLAEYFDNPTFTGTPTLTTTLPRLDLDLDRVGPSPQLTATHYAARWTGALIPPAPGDYTLRVHIERCWDCTTHDRFRLFLDGRLALENDGTHPEPDTYTLHAADTTPHTLRLELAHTGEDEGIALEWLPPANALLDEAVHAAEQADVIVAAVGLSPDLEGEALQLQLDGFSGGDRTTLDLPAAQRALLTRLAELHKPLVLVLTSGSAVALDPATYHANALLEAWYPGEEGGHALANILDGRTGPSGRLPVTFYRSATDLPAFDDYSMAHRTYRYFTGPVLYPFGFGLTYTPVTYGTVHLSTTHLTAGQPLTATVTLTNPGTLPADEVSELYLTPKDLPGAPNLALRAFQRTRLAPGQSRTLTFTLSPTQLSFVDPDGRRSVRPGHYRLSIGPNQPNKATPGTPFQITGSFSLPFESVLLLSTP
jgi:beta-glucosidase